MINIPEIFTKVPTHFHFLFSSSRRCPWSDFLEPLFSLAREILLLKHSVITNSEYFSGAICWCGTQRLVSAACSSLECWVRALPTSLTFLPKEITRSVMSGIKMDSELCYSKLTLPLRRASNSKTVQKLDEVRLARYGSNNDENSWAAFEVRCK